MFFIALLLEEEVLYVEYSVYEHQVSSIHTCTVQTLVLRLFLLHMYVQFKRRVLLYDLLVFCCRRRVPFTQLSVQYSIEEESILHVLFSNF